MERSDRTGIARMEQYLNRSDSMKVEIEELYSLLGPEDWEVNLRQILRNANKKGGRIFDIFSSEGQSEHLVAKQNAMGGPSQVNGDTGGRGKKEFARG